MVERVRVRLLWEVGPGKHVLYSPHRMSGAYLWDGVMS